MSLKKDILAIMLSGVATMIFMSMFFGAFPTNAYSWASFDTGYLQADPGEQQTQYRIAFDFEYDSLKVYSYTSPAITCQGSYPYHCEEHGEDYTFIDGPYGIRHLHVYGFAQFHYVFLWMQHYENIIVDGDALPGGNTQLSFAVWRTY